MRTIQVVANRCIERTRSALGRMNIRGVQRVFAAALIVVCALSIISCGGGSSGTGEDDTVGQMIDRSCQPIRSFDMSQVGLETIEQLTAEDGTFTLTPTGASSIQISGGSRRREVDVSSPMCVLIVFDAGEVVSVNAYPRITLSECSIESVLESDGRREVPPCAVQGKE